MVSRPDPPPAIDDPEAEGRGRRLLAVARCWSLEKVVGGWDPDPSFPSLRANLFLPETNYLRAIDD